jgi:hypothetical protein
MMHIFIILTRGRGETEGGLGPTEPAWGLLTTEAEGREEACAPRGSPRRPGLRRRGRRR